MTTIRELMLAQQARHEGWTHPATKRQWCPRCDEVWPCADRVAADAVLATLDEDGEIIEGPDMYAVRTGRRVLIIDVPDPGVS